MEQSGDGLAEGLADGLAELARLLDGRRILALTGAGISTESGIPDFRSPESLARNHKPITFAQFTGSEGARSRYWARSSIGWPRMKIAKPNAGHIALARMESVGVFGAITQNVDGLHGEAGSTRVIELHGTLDAVTCLACHGEESREAYQSRIFEENPGWDIRVGSIAPDGDAPIPDELVETFHVPVCTVCGGVQKPDIVFFGESVPSGRVMNAWSWLDSADVLLVAGSSLTVYSGYRFVRKAAQVDTPIAIVNRGVTRGDDLATVRLEGTTGDVLPLLAELLGC